MSALKIIDFTGISGAGKSTLSIAVYESFSKEYKCINSEFVKKKKKRESSFKLLRYSKLVYMLIKNPRTTYKFLSYYKSIRPISTENLRRTIIAIKNFLILKSISKECTEYDFLILDEGTLHKVWTISLYGKILSQKELVKLINYVSDQLNLINIHSYIDRESAVKRILGRNTFESRLDKMSYYETSEILRLNELNKEILQGIISSNKKIKTIKLNGEDSVEKKLKQAIEKITM